MFKHGLGIIALLLVIGCESNTYVGDPLQVTLAGSAGAAGADLGGEAGMGEGGAETGGAVTGGSLPTGGAVTGGTAGSTGGVVQTGGALPTGGFAGSTGGSPETGGAVTGGTAGSTGGVVQTGGALPTGGFAGSTGGSPETGGVPAGGAGGAGGSIPVGGAETGGSGTGGTATQKVVFITADTTGYSVPFLEGGTFPPGTTNVQAADIICQHEAEAGGLAGRTFQAWLPTSTATAQERIQGDGPWYRTDGWGPVFSDWDALAGNPAYPINRMADGTLRSYGVYVWGENRVEMALVGTCTGELGDYSSYHDGVNYRYAMAGEQTYTDERWTSREAPACNTPRAFYCFEI